MKNVFFPYKEIGEKMPKQVSKKIKTKAKIVALLLAFKAQKIRR